MNNSHGFFPLAKHQKKMMTAHIVVIFFITKKRKENNDIDVVIVFFATKKTMSNYLLFVTFSPTFLQGNTRRGRRWHMVPLSSSLQNKRTTMTLCVIAVFFCSETKGRKD